MMLRGVSFRVWNRLRALAYRTGMAVYTQKKVRLWEVSSKRPDAPRKDLHARHSSKSLIHLSIYQIRHTRRIECARDSSQDDARGFWECVAH
jgi:hypothetical protein